MDTKDSSSTETAGSTGKQVIGSEGRTKQREMQFSSPPGLYVLSPSATKGAISDQISCRLAQLKSMILATTGDCGEAFRQGMTDECHDHYMWACSNAVSEISELFSMIGEVPA